MSGVCPWPLLAWTSQKHLTTFAVLGCGALCPALAFPKPPSRPSKLFLALAFFRSPPKLAAPRYRTLRQNYAGGGRRRCYEQLGLCMVVRAACKDLSQGLQRRAAWAIASHCEPDPDTELLGWTHRTTTCVVKASFSCCAPARAKEKDAHSTEPHVPLNPQGPHTFAPGGPLRMDPATTHIGNRCPIHQETQMLRRPHNNNGNTTARGELPTPPN